MASDSRVNERVSFSRITCRPEMSFRSESVFMTAARELPLVLIHGMFGDFLDWEPVLEPLSQSHCVIAVDLPSSGLSSKPRREYTAEFFVATLRELCT
jgi:pimeloyl-ACP methyl ester carboxylesterase